MTIWGQCAALGINLYFCQKGNIYLNKTCTWNRKNPCSMDYELQARNKRISILSIFILFFSNSEFFLIIHIGIYKVSISNFVFPFSFRRRLIFNRGIERRKTLFSYFHEFMSRFSIPSSGLLVYNPGYKNN